MKITKSYIKQIILEELNLLQEKIDPSKYGITSTEDVDYFNMYKTNPNFKNIPVLQKKPTIISAIEKYRADVDAGIISIS